MAKLCEIIEDGKVVGRLFVSDDTVLTLHPHELRDITPLHLQPPPEEPQDGQQPPHP